MNNSLPAPAFTTPTRSIKEIPALKEEDFQRFSKLLLDRCGLFFSENRHTELEHGIRYAFAASTSSDINEFYDLLCDPQGDSLEMDLLVNAVTVSETHFFRDTPQFNALFASVFPQLI